MTKDTLNKSGQLDFEIHFFEKLISQKPDFVDALIALADAYTKRGKYIQGLQIDRKLAHLCPEDPNVFYNLACSFSLVGETDKSFASLGKAVRLGYRDIQHMLRDPDLQKIRNDVRFAKLTRQIKLLQNR
ncbi:MAG TPA: hypothetical protein PKL97_03850 [Candidatus Omnitrophota bacterium]|nr:hypothetical protein [Candidatus Omnitrophota bacterium]